MSNLPEIVYHYTSAEALLAIIQSGRLRAGSTRSLNDGYELRAGPEALRKYAAGQPAGSLPDRVQKTLQDPDFNVADEVNSVYVLSASAARDDTAQWVNYADDGRGFAIGFRTGQRFAIESPPPSEDRSSLKPRGVEPEFADMWTVVPDGAFSQISEWQPVLYDEKELVAEFEALCRRAGKTWSEAEQDRRKLLDPFLGKTDSDAYRSASAEAFFGDYMANVDVVGDAHTLFSRIKVAPWKSEREYRCVAVLRQGDCLKHFKASAGGIASYVNLLAKPADSDGSLLHVLPDQNPPRSLPIVEVVCGPRLEEEAQYDLKNFLELHGLGEVNVTSSEVQLR